MKNLLIIDRLDYQKRQAEFLNLMNETLGGDNHIVYTAYEDDTIRKVRNYKLVGSLLQHILYWKKSYDYAKQILKDDYDNIYCINPIVGIFLGLKNKKAKINLGGFLFEPKKNKLYYKLRILFTQKSLKGISKAIVYGKREVKYYAKIFGINKFKFIKYGIDYDNATPYTKQKLPEKYIFSGGGSNRDYPTLVKAYNNCTNSYPLVIATQPWRLNDLDTDKIKVLSDVVVENFGNVMGRSQVLVLSLRDDEISAGHMVMFQAMSNRVPILVNDIPAIRDYVSENEVCFYESENIADLTAKLETIKANEAKYQQLAANAYAKYQQELTFKAFLKRFMQA